MMLGTTNIKFSSCLNVNMQINSYKDLQDNVTNCCHSNFTKHIKTLCGQNTEGLNVNLGGIYSYH